jgi:hypothetical protein
MLTKLAELLDKFKRGEADSFEVACAIEDMVNKIIDSKEAK